MKQLITHSDKETQQFAQKLAKSKKYNVIGLIGDLGAGKTTFAQGFAKGLGIKDKIISPTFVLIRQHGFNVKETLYHIDLYRLEDDIDIKSLGLEELWENPDNIVIIEWAEKIEKFLPRNTFLIYFDRLDDHKRKINIKTLS